MINSETGKRGNLFIKFEIEFPKMLSEKVRSELRELLA